MRVRAKAKMQYHHRDCHWIMLCHFRGCSGFKIAFHKNQNDLCYRVCRDFTKIPHLILGPFEPWLHFKQVAICRGAAATSSNWRGTVCEGHREVCSLFHLKAGPQNVQGGFDSTCKDHINAESWGQGYKCPKKLLNCMENQVKTQTRMSIWPKLLRPERPAKSPRGIHVAPVARSIGSGKYVSSQGWTTAIHRQTNKKATPRTSSLYKSIKGCRTSFFQTHPRLRNVILQDLADTPTQNQDN